MSTRDLGGHTRPEIAARGAFRLPDVPPATTLLQQRSEKTVTDTSCTGVRPTKSGKFEARIKMPAGPAGT